ncbi:amino acid adenylation domain-containing protein, partial [Kordia sp. YSTF-M3]
MEAIIQLLSELREHDIKLELNNGNLDVISYGEKISQDLIVKIKTHKEEIKAYLAFLESAKKEAAFIPEVQAAEMYAMSPAQRRLWLLSQFEGGSEAYNMPVSIQLNGEYHIENFKKAILATIDRHEILRTVFIKDKNEEVQQKIETREAIGFEIKYIDYRNEKNPEFIANAFVKADTNQAFDLNKGPLVRVCLLQTSDEKFVFYYNLHHSISDAWSMDILARDVMAYYEAYQSNSEVELPKLRIQYKDYASWQLAQQTSETYQTHKNYWLDKFSGELPLLEIASHAKRPKIKTYNGATLQTHISPLLTGKLEQFITEQQGSLFTTMLALWNVLLSKYTSQKDIIIGSPVAGRNHSDLKDQIGFYVNMMALRNEVNSEESFKDFYKRVKDDTLLSFNHQDYPFDQLVEDLQIIRNPDRNPVFDVVLVVKNEEKNNKETILDYEKIVALDAQTSKYDLQLSFQKTNEALVFELNYNTDVYDRNLIEDLVVHFKALLSDVLLDTNQSIASLNYLSIAEKTTLLEDFSGIKNIAAVRENVVDLFQAQVLKTPTAVAVSDHEHNYTYEELDRLSNQFSNYLLQTHQVGVGSFVGLSLSRDARYIISLLGILKSGCGFVPIDANYPSDRQSFMLKNSGASLLITETDHQITGFTGTVIGYDAIDLRAFSDQLVATSLMPTSSAYIMYTSGSTGIPKGVEVTHQNIVRLVQHTNYYQFTEDSVVLSTGSFSFDATTFEFFGPLLNGGKLVLSSYDALLDVDLLKSSINAHGVTVMWFTSGWLNELVSTDISLFKNLQTVIAGGDKLSSFHIKQLRQAYPSLQIINGYGPTENTTFSLTYEIGSEVENTIPIGYPISGSSAYILDDSKNPVGIGIVGEIYLGGHGLANGYVGDQPLTNEKFISNPFQANTRLYKTGDLGMWSSDGKVHFMGRRDSQLKIRGHRIELGELSHIAQSHERISDAHAAVIESVTGGKSLVLYYISDSENIETDLRSYLQERLPSYMLPSYYHSMDRF